MGQSLMARRGMAHSAMASGHHAVGLEGLLSPWQCRVTALVVWVLIITSWHQLSPFHPQDAEQFCLTPACIEPNTHIPHGRAQFPVLLLGLTLLKHLIYQQNKNISLCWQSNTGSTALCGLCCPTSAPHAHTSHGSQSSLHPPMGSPEGTDAELRIHNNTQFLPFPSKLTAAAQSAQSHTAVWGSAACTHTESIPHPTPPEPPAPGAAPYLGTSRRGRVGARRTGAHGRVCGV